MNLVCVGAPFEEQTMYGPFSSFDEAGIWCTDNLGPFSSFDEAGIWCTDNLGHKTYIWIITLHSPEEISDGKKTKTQTRSA